MSYYQQLLTEISVSESAVDCNRCVSEWKCCTYRPFIANFLAEAPLNLDAVSDEELRRDWDFLIVGLSPSMDYRKYFLKKGKWGFGSDASLLCTFYDTKSGGCRVWHRRPAVCRTFFCKSTYVEGLEYWKTAEELTWRLEWVLLEDFLYTKGWTFDDVKEVKAYLEEKATSHSTALPKEYRLSLEEARVFYTEARDHVEALKPDYVHEILGADGVAIYRDLLARRQKIR